MQTLNKTYPNPPPIIQIEIPEALQHRPVEVIIRPLSEQATDTNTNGWPIGFFEETAGAWAGEPLIREQPCHCKNT